MVHKKYTYKDGKKFGPYYYETKRINGKVVTTYLGTELPEKFSSPTPSFWKIAVPFFVVIVIFTLLFLSIDFTGNVALDIKTNYEVGEAIEGTLTFTLKEGELIPINSKVLLTYGRYSKEVLLSSLVSEETFSGDFYAEGVSISGRGDGYGLIGSKTIYPEVSFSLKVSEEGESEIASETQDIDEIVSEPVVGEDFGEEEKFDKKEQEEAGKSGKEEESVLDNKEDGKKDEDKASSESEPSAGITGSAVSSDIVSGVVSKDNDFVYEISESETAELVEGSVSYDGTELDDDVIKVKIKKGEVTVTTDYSVELEGFGEDYLGNEEKKIEIDLSEFGFVADQDEKISISLVYNENEIVSASEDISVSENETTDSEDNETETNETIGNGTIANVTNGTVILPPNVTEVNQTTNVTIPTTLNASAFSVNVTQFSAVLGQPVRWAKKVAFDVNGSVELHIEIPASAENITIEPLNLTEYLEIEGLSEEEFAVLSGDSLAPAQISEIVSDNSSVQDAGVSSANKTVIQEEITVGITGQIISGKVSADIELSKDSWLKKIFGRFFGVTGRVVDTVPDASGAVQKVTFNLSDKDFGVAVEYYTDAPVSEEISEGTRKTFAVSSPADVHYENVLLYTNISDSFEITDFTKVKIEWVENASQRLGVYFANDTNGNGFYDYVEWIAPSLSNQTFNIIVIINAQHLNTTREFISNIYNETRELDGVWSETIPEGHFVRVTFETNLTNVNDITIYPRIVNGTAVGEAKIEVYENNKTEIIAEFTNITENQYNKIFLTRLADNYSQDTFDLRAVNVSFEFDHIIDPSVDPAMAIEALDLAVLDGNTFVLAWCDETSDDITFAIYDTDSASNTTRVLDPVDADAAVSTCAVRDEEVSVAALNSTTFVVAWFDDADDDVTFQTFDTNGNSISNVIDADTNSGTASVTGVEVSTLNATDFVLSWVNNSDVFFAEYNYLGSTILSPIRAVTSVSTATYGYAVGVSAFNLSSFVLSWKDATNSDATFRTYFTNGTAISAETDADVNIANTWNVDVEAFNESIFVMGWYDSNTGQGIKAQVFDIKGNNFSTDILVDTDIGITTNSPALDVSPLNSTAFSIVWFDDTDDDHSYAVYGINGNTIVSPTDADTTSQSAGNHAGAVISSAFTVNVSICGDNFVYAWTKNATDTVWDKYQPNGTLWNGTCVSAFPRVTINSPLNGTGNKYSSMLLNASLRDSDYGETLTSKIFISEEPNVGYEYMVSYEAGLLNTSELSYNLTALPTNSSDPGVFLLYHFDYNTVYGENLTLINDFSPSGIDAVIGGVNGTRGRGYFGRAHEKEPSGDTITIADTQALSSPNLTGSFSTMFWLNLTDTNFTNGFPGIFSKGATTNDREYLIAIRNSTKALYVSFGNGTTQRSVETSNNSLLQQFIWYHIAVTYNRSTENLTLYVNGLINTSINGTLSGRGLMNSTGSFTIGQGLTPVNGKVYIDDLALFNRTLTKEDVLNAYRLRNGTYYWKVNVTDSLGAQNETNVLGFSIDSHPPHNVTLAAPANTSSYSSGTMITFNWTAYDYVDTNPACNLTVDLVVNASWINVTNGTLANWNVTGFTSV
ncbi:MAG: hypothetical protein AABY16_00440, partial [Nanoarchaeota archaeon]